MFEKPLKLTHNDSHKVFFTSDSHFRHNQKFIFGSRGYKDRYEHDDALITKINEIVRPQDTLIHLGDFCLNITPSEFNEILARIYCQNILYIWGNHNSCIRKSYEDAVTTQYGNDIEVYPYTIGKLTYLGYYKELSVNGHMIVIHHYPHQIFNQMQKGAYQLSGHSHYTNPTTQLDNKVNKILDVGWDGHGKPLSFSEIQKIMMNKNHISKDNHH